MENLYYFTSMNFSDFFRKKPAADNANKESVQLSNGIELSHRLAPYKGLIEKTALPFVRITATPAGNLSITQSNFAGTPYWPAGKEYPKDGEGKHMCLLSQLNFAKITHLKGYCGKGIM